jgi:hypothetical protein
MYLKRQVGMLPRQHALRLPALHLDRPHLFGFGLRLWRSVWVCVWWERGGVDEWS